MRVIPILLLLILPVLCIGQTHTSIDFVTGIDYSSSSYNRIILTSPVGLPSLKPIGKTNFRFGANFNVRLFDRILVRTGLRYASVGYRTEFNDIRWGSEIGPNGWEPDPTLPRYIHSSFDYIFIETPLVAHYEINRNKFSTFVEFGFASNYYLTTKVHNKSNLSSSKMSIDELESGSGRRLHLAAIFAFGVHYSLSPKFRLFLQPTFRFHLTEVNTAFTTSGFFQSHGLEIGVSRTLTFAEK